MTRTSTLLMLLALAGSSILHAQSQPTHPTDTTASYLGSFTIEWIVSAAPLSLSLSSTQIPSGSGAGCKVADLVTAWRTGSGRIDYVLSAAQIIAQGDCSDLDSIATRTIFQRLSERAIATGISLGYSPCVTYCDGLDRSTVYVTSCVLRNGSAENTRFEPCGASYAHRRYSICCPTEPSAPLIMLIGESGQPCETPCEVTAAPDEAGPGELE